MNLYVHFPFCRRKCTYCALLSRAGASESERSAYVDKVAARLRAALSGEERLDTVYFGGGSPALCDLKPLFGIIAPRLAADAEFTVELHPLDVSPGLLDTLKAGGVNRISMGVQSLEDSVLAAMNRRYTAKEAFEAFRMAKSRFGNAGIDLIAGFPGAKSDFSRLADWGLVHCSVYSLILEDGTLLKKQVAGGKAKLPGDDETMDEIRQAESALAGLGLARYEISNYAIPGRECRHNMATWCGEDYTGIGEGACGRIGLKRTCGGRGLAEEAETVSPERDRLERTIFRLRTYKGLDASGYPEWQGRLDGFVREGLLEGSFPVYRLTARGREVCDSILSELV